MKKTLYKQRLFYIAHLT